METKPRNGDDGEKAAASMPPRKARPPVEIDLPAESVSEVKPEAESSPTIETMASETTPAEPAPPARPSLALPVLAALVAGIAGSLGVQALLGGSDAKLASALDQRLMRLEQAKPAPAPLPPEMADRLAKAEKALGEITPREQALQAEITRLSAALKSLAERPASPAAGGGPAPETASAIARLSAATEAATKQAEAQSARLAGLDAQIASLGKNMGGTQGELARASGLVVVTQMLAEAFQRNEALGSPLETMKALGVPAERLAPLAPFAQSPPPSLASLGTELRERAKAANGAAASAPGDFLTRLKEGAAALVEVRRTGEITGADDAAHLARAEQAVARGDLATALTLVGRLSAPLAERFAGWKAKAEARAKAGDALGLIRQESLAGLARAASPAKP